MHSTTAIRGHWAVLGLFALTHCGADPTARTQAGPVDDPVPVPEEPHEEPSDCADGSDNDGDGFVDCDDADCRAESDQCRFAPPVDRSIPSNLIDSWSFLYTGPDAAQNGLAKDQLALHRFSVIHGAVTGEDSGPLRDVRVRVHGHPELGFTKTRADGRFDLVVNGGGNVVLEYEKGGYLGATRTVPTAWQRHATAPNVGLVRVASRKEHVAAGAAQAVASKPTFDVYGEHGVLVVFAPETEAVAVLPGGEREPLDGFHLRINEYPVELPAARSPGETARCAPATLPSNAVAHTLAFTVDEARELEASRVDFSKPVAVYSENFLGLPVGASLPLTYHDAETARSEPAGTGRVVAVVEIRGGRAALDVDGDGAADSGEALEALGVSETELSALAEHFSAGATLGRQTVIHFSAFTEAWSVIAPGIAVPNALPKKLKARFDRRSRRGNVLVEDLVVRESVPLVGTPFSLVYQTDRTTAYGAGFDVEVPLLGAEVPDGLQHVYLVTEVAGRQITAMPLAPEPNLSTTVHWDGKDVKGDLLQGEHAATVWVGYGFDGGIAPPTDDEALDGPNETVLPITVPEVVVWRKQETLLGVFDARGFQLGGFGLDAQHSYDVSSGVLYFGDGTRRTADDARLLAVAVDPETSHDGEAPSRHIDRADSVAVAPDGSVIVSDDSEAGGRVWRISLDGEYAVILGRGAEGEAGSVELGSPQGVAVDSESGDVFVTDSDERIVYRLDAAGAVDVLLGDRDDAVARHALEKPDGLAINRFGDLLVADEAHVWRLRGNTVESIAGGGSNPEASTARELQLDEASGLAVDPVGGSFFVSSRRGHRVYKVDENGAVTVVAGTGKAGFSGDGLPGPRAELDNPRGLAFSADGTLMIADQENGRIRRVSTDGRIVTIAGGDDEFPLWPIPATSAKISVPDGLAFGPNQVLYAGGSERPGEPAQLYKVYTGVPLAFGSDEILLPSSDGRQAFRFDSRGRHLDTRDGVTGIEQLRFDYDDRGLLTAVEDRLGDKTRIERDTNGTAAAIVGPHNHRSGLSIDSGALKHVDDPLSRRVAFEYHPDHGLLEVVSDAERGRRSYEFDAKGRVKKVVEPSGYSETYQPDLGPSHHAITVTPPNGAALTYRAEATNPGVLDGVTITDSDGVTRTGLEHDDATFFAFLPGGARIEGLEAPLAQWGNQVRIPSETTLETASGRTLSEFVQVTLQGLPLVSQFQTATNPFDFDQYSVLTETDGRFAERIYDKNDNAVITLSPTGRRTTTQLDEAGHPAIVTAPGLATITYDYDSRGRLESMTMSAAGEARTTRFDYGNDGSIASMTDAASRTTQFEHDAALRLIGLVRPDDATLAWRYDKNDNVLGITPAGRPEHAFTYEAGVRLEQYLPPDVDDAGLGGTSAGHIAYVYDDDHRLSRIAFADGRHVDIAYSLAGRLRSLRTSRGTIAYRYASDLVTVASIEGPDATLSYSYDSPLLISTSYSGSITGSVTRDYDDSFRIAELTVAGSDPVAYEYDDDSAIVSAGSLRIARDPDTGFVTGTDAGIVTTAETTSSFGEIDRLSVAAGGDPLFSQTFERDRTGRITQLIETSGESETTWTFEYDVLDRLIAATHDGSTTRWYYDANGNRFPGADLTGAHYDEQDRLTRYEDWTFETTQAGDLVRRTRGNETIEYDYDELGNLLRVENRTTGDTIAYLVDPLGRRIGRKRNGVLTHGWLYDQPTSSTGSGKGGALLDVAPGAMSNAGGFGPIAQVDATGAVLARFVYATKPHVPDLMIQGDTTYRIITDWRGSVRQVIDTRTGEVAQRLDYDAFGRVIRDTNPGFQPFGFAGGLYDATTGLVRFGARDYDAEIGRWLTKDPILFEGRQGNLYLYAGGDPVNRVDPSGLSGVIAIENGGDYGFLGGINYARGQVYDTDLGLFDFESHNALLGLFASGSIWTKGWGIYGGPIDALLNGQSFVVQLAVIDISLLFTSEGWRGITISAGLGGGFGAAWVPGNTKLTPVGELP